MSLRAEDLVKIAAPNDNVIHVWRVSIDAARVREMLPLLAEDERARAARFVFPKDHNQFVVVRGWLRTLLGVYLSCEPVDVRFAYGAQGKPVVAAPVSSVDLRFNVSHSGDVALLAFAVGRDVGIDVEKIDARVDPIALGLTCFSVAEQGVVRRAPDHGRLETFFRYWTAKEAYIKVLGGGLSIPLGDFTVETSDEPVWRVSAAPGLCDSVMVRPVVVPVGYVAAVAVDGSEWEVETRDLG